MLNNKEPLNRKFNNNLMDTTTNYHLTTLLVYLMHPRVFETKCLTHFERDNKSKYGYFHNLNELELKYGRFNDNKKLMHLNVIRKKGSIFYCN